jgi:O-antigen/teichoic acid export membrane protein
MATSRIALNTGWNLAGQGVPILAAIAAVPILIRSLGEARFGIVGLGWLVTGYFALFDFGISRATTRLMAALRESGDGQAHGTVFWNSAYVHGVLSVLGGIGLAVAVPWLVRSAFAVPPELRDEAIRSFYWLAFSIPALVFASFLRGVLESEHRFDLVNAVKIPAGVLNYLAPLMALQFSHRVDVVIAVIALSRWIMMAAYGAFCNLAVPIAGERRALDRGLILRLASDGGWLTVASVVAPMVMVIDRLAIARLCSLEAVTHYVVSYETITKLWILSASIMSAAFPRMSASSPDALRQVSDQTFRWLLLLATPAAVIAIVFGKDLLTVWVGGGIAAHSTAILQWLAVGVWINVLAQVPLTTLQAAGRADVVGKIQFIELPLYALLVWRLVMQFGPVGAAMAWVIRALVDWIALRFSLTRTLPRFEQWPGTSVLRITLLSIVIVSAWLISDVTGFGARLALALLLVGGLFGWHWRLLLTGGERDAILGRLGRAVSARNR